MAPSTWVDNMNETETPPADSFGDEMVWVGSYQGHLPRSDNIETAPIQNGVSGISHDGDIFCVDCAKGMGLVAETTDGSLVALVDEEQMSFAVAPRTGIVLPSHESDTQYHCGLHKHCCNSLDGDEHPYNHDLLVGIGIEQKIIQH